MVKNPTTPVKSKTQTKKLHTPVSNTSTNTTKSSSTVGTFASLSRSTKRSLDLKSPVRRNKKVDIKAKGIEEVDWMDTMELKPYLCSLIPNRSDEIYGCNSAGSVQKIGLELYETKTLKAFLCHCKVKYGITGMGGIEDDVSKTKQQLIKDLVKVFHIAYQGLVNKE